MMTYGFSPKARIQGVNLRVTPKGQKYDVKKDGKILGEVSLAVPGLHNILNSLAAVGVGLEMKMSFESIVEGLSQYQGVDRRLQKKGEFNGALVIDDYGHHPTEIKATLSALRQAYPKRRVVVAFQPHRYSRTETCWNDFLTCFKDADVVGLLDIYAAGETPKKNINSKRLAKATSLKHKNVFYWGTVKAATTEVRNTVRSGDVILTLGAGNVWKLGYEITK